ncbi:MAG: hypothetical protein U9N32_08350 [Spirochaetota bacterium]|nr:hypothetical protein [Spirochaetota bacterium]
MSEKNIKSTKKVKLKEFNWKAELRTNITTVEQLKEYITLEEGALPGFLWIEI